MSVKERRGPGGRGGRDVGCKWGWLRDVDIEIQNQRIGAGRGARQGVRLQGGEGGVRGGNQDG